MTRKRRSHVQKSSEIIEAICDRIAAGESISKICRDDGMPNRSTVMRWMKDEEVAANIARAGELQADALADDLLEIADDPLLAPDDKRIRIHARQWLAGKQRPKKYGDRIDVTAEVNHLHRLSDEQLEAEARMLAERLHKALLPIVCHTDDD